MEKSTAMQRGRLVSLSDFTTQVGADTTVAPITWPSAFKTFCKTDSITMTWSDNSNNETGFEIYRSSDAGKTFERIGTAGMNATSYTDTTAAPNIVYSYKARAFNSATVSSFSNGANGMLTPPAPSDLRSTVVETNAITLAWKDNSTGERGFHLYRSTDGVNFKIITNIGAELTSYRNNSLTGGTTYYYKISAWNSYGESLSNAVAVTTAPAPVAPTASAPTAPSGLNFAQVAATSLTVRWSDNSSSESGFRVYRSTDGANYSLIANPGTNVTSFYDTTVKAGTTYYYKVSAWNSAGESTSSAAGVTTLSTAPTAPGSVNVTNLGPTSLTLNWGDTSSTESGFHVYRSTDGATFSMVATVAAGGTSYNDSNLSSGATYFYKVGAYNAYGETVSGTTSATTTTVAPPPAPTTTTTTTTTTLAVKIATKYMTSFTELDIDGTSGNDSILVTSSNGVLTITANGTTSTYSGTIGNVVIHGFGGDDSITVDSSVNIASLLYGGDGSDTLINRTSGKATIVDIDTSANYMVGNGINTSFWANPTDSVSASSTEISNGAVNRITNWYQPSVGAVPRSLAGQNLAEPTDAGTVRRLTANSFWGKGPSINDINQGSLADCYYLATLGSLANNETVKFMNTGVDLGDGTYAIRFVRGGVTTYVRVDGDISNNYYAHPGASGNLWGSLYEKAYAYIRTGASTYASLGWGNPNSVMSDLGFSNSATSPSSSDATILSVISGALSSNKGVVACTRSSITAGAPLIGSHAYSVVAAWRDANGVVQVTLRNPWGYDGAGSDGNAGDALVTISYSVFSANFALLSYTTV